MASIDLRDVLKKEVIGKKHVLDVERIRALDPIQQLLEFRSLFRMRLFAPQVEFRIQKPDLPFTDKFFEDLVAAVHEWYDEVTAEKWDFDVPTFEELEEEANGMDYASSLESCPWFMTSRSEPVCS